MLSLAWRASLALSKNHCTQMQDPYAVLGVSSSATISEIKAAYRQKAKETHPDSHGGSPVYVSQFREVTDAYALLSDPDQRSRYDRTGAADESQVASDAKEIYEAIAYIRNRAAEAKEEAKSYALGGAAWLAAGVILSYITHEISVSNGGNRFIVFTGLIFFGFYKALLGFYEYSRIGLKASALERNVWNLVTAPNQPQ